MTTFESKITLRMGRLLALVPSNHKATLAGRSLPDVIQAAVGQINESELTPVAPNDAGPAYRPKTLLTLVAFFYARQTYGSKDIETALDSDGNIRQLCEH